MIPSRRPLSALRGPEGPGQALKEMACPETLIRMPMTLRKERGIKDSEHRENSQEKVKPPTCSSTLAAVVRAKPAGVP